MTNVEMMTNEALPQIDYSNALVSPVELKARERKKINDAAGDNDSIQGTVADATQIAMLALGKLLIGLKDGKSMDDIIASDPAFAACVAFADAEADGSMKVPFKHKPEGDALADIVHRTNAVAELYSA